MNYIELLGVISGFITVFLTIRENIWCWPTAIINVIFFFIMFYQAKLYADMGLQVFFLILSVYGWYHWLHGGKNKSELLVSRTTIIEWLILIPFSLGGTLVMGFLLSSKTDASLPYWDSATTILSFAAQYLLAQKKIENFLFWMVVDVLSIGIYIYKDLFFTSALYFTFLILVIIGFFSWRKNFTKNPRV